jgi:hypothetical protein
MNEKKIAGILVLTLCIASVFAMSYIFGENVEATTDDEEVQIAVSIADLFQLDVKPYDIIFNSVRPGETSNVFTDTITGVTGQSKIQLRNVGSLDITKIWVNATSPGDGMASSPFGSGDSARYDPANMFALTRLDENGTVVPDADEYFFPNRREYAQSFYDQDGDLIKGQVIPYLNITETVTHHNMTIGRFHFADKEWFWSLVKTSAGTPGCNNTNTRFVMSRLPHTTTAMGDVGINYPDCIDGGTCVAWQLEAGGFRSLVQSTSLQGDGTTSPGPNTVPSEFVNYGIKADHSCEHVDFIYWNRASSTGGTEHARYLLDSAETTTGPQSFQGNHLTEFKPGSELTTHVQLKIPYGTIAGAISGGGTGGLVYFIASDA